tara:strand:+ start:473 stop:1192 length:720 start_codon:yes stop_codon:yes gene_type:complete
MQGAKVDKALAMQQWFQLKNILSHIGVNIKLIDQSPDLPDMTFTANAGTVRDNAVVLSNFKHPVRQGETEHFREWFRKEGYNIHPLPPNAIFEGTGDTVICDDLLIGGYGFRSNLTGLRMAAEILDLELLPLKLTNPNFYHLDTCFALLRPDLGLYYPGAFSAYTISKLKKHMELIPVSESSANKFVCNSIVHNGVIIMPAGNEEVADKLEGYGFSARLINTSEFLKSGGSLKCMSLWI